MNMVYYFKTERLVVVGDFFHSKANKELPLLKNGEKIFLH
jgi:hypothetical protein